MDQPRLCPRAAAVRVGGGFVMIPAAGSLERRSRALRWPCCRLKEGAAGSANAGGPSIQAKAPGAVPKLPAAANPMVVAPHYAAVTMMVAASPATTVVVMVHAITAVIIAAHANSRPSRFVRCRFARHQSSRWPGLSAGRSPRCRRRAGHFRDRLFRRCDPTALPVPEAK
jgi:hypothetical protein